MAKNKKRIKSAAAVAANVWIKQKARDLDPDSFALLAIAIINGAPITDDLPKGAKSIIKLKLMAVYLASDEFDEDEEIPKIKRISQMEHAHAEN